VVATLGGVLSQVRKPVALAVVGEHDPGQAKGAAKLKKADLAAAAEAVAAKAAWLPPIFEGCLEGPSEG
jgi:hypothetical protein